MDILQYGGQKVYTSSHNKATVADLEGTETSVGRITDAYFFKLTPNKYIEKTKFDRKAIEKVNSGLMIEVEEKNDEVSVSIAGLERITEFLYDSKAIGDLSTLKGRKVTKYNRGIRLLGISLQ